MIVVTGGEGFIGKNLVKELERQGNIGVVSLDTKTENLGFIYSWLLTYADQIDCIFHLGAITDTINLKPLNPYGWSKQQFDIWAEIQEQQPPNWYGLKFFNVYGYGEAQKGKMASVAFHMFNQIDESKKVKLFKSHRPDYENGEQKRDFIYIDDIVDVCLFLYDKKPLSGIYNVGTGKARTFNDLGSAVFKSLDIPLLIDYIDTPILIRDKYQYFTEAKINKLRMTGYKKPFSELEDGISKYINKLNDKTC